MTLSHLLVGAFATLLGVQAAGAQEPAAATRDADWRLSPRLGVSHATGLMGIEAQQKHFAVAYGVIPVCVFECFTIQTASVKYYLNADGDSWAVGVFSWNDGYGWDDILGAAVEYRWRPSSGWELVAGVATGGSGRDLSIEGPIPSVSLGYAFAVGSGSSR